MKIFVSVIIPVRDLSFYLMYENLPAFEKQTWKDFEVIVLVNEHGQYDLTLLKKYKWLRIIPTGKITRPAQKRDIGVRNAKGSILAFIDDDAYPKKDWLKNAVSVFHKKKISCVCGPGILAQKTTMWEKIIDEILISPIGSGGYTYRFLPQKERYVDDYPSMNFLITKKLFMTIGGFNNDFWPGEDSKLCNDIVYVQKEKIYYSPMVIVYHHRRNELIPYVRQHAQYGYHRGAFAAVGDKNSLKVSYFLPSLFLLYLLLIIIALPIFHAFTLLPLFAYVVLSMYIGIKAAISQKNISFLLYVPYTMFLTHIVYGASFIKGMVVGFQKKDNIYNN